MSDCLQRSGLNGTADCLPLSGFRPAVGPVSETSPSADKYRAAHENNVPLHKTRYKFTVFCGLSQGKFQIRVSSSENLLSIFRAFSEHLPSIRTT